MLLSCSGKRKKPVQCKHKPENGEWTILQEWTVQIPLSIFYYFSSTSYHILIKQLVLNLTDLEMFCENKSIQSHCICMIAEFAPLFSFDPPLAVLLNWINNVCKNRTKFFIIDTNYRLMQCVLFKWNRNQSWAKCALNCSCLCVISVGSSVFRQNGLSFTFNFVEV